MKLKSLLILIFTLVSFAGWAQDGGIKGKLVSRDGRAAVSNATVTIESTGQTVVTDNEGNFTLGNLPSGDYKITFTAPDFEQTEVVVRVDKNVKNINQVAMGSCSGAGGSGRLDLRRIRHGDLGFRCAGNAFVAVGIERHLQQHRIVQIQRNAFQNARI